jgi:thioredoxin 1
MVTEGSTDIVAVTTASFDDVVQRSDSVVLVDFWAEWCASCKMLAPVLNDLAQEFAGRLTVAAIDVDRDPEPAQRYDVVTVPTLLLFHNGEMTKRIVGAQSKAALIRELSHLA